MQLQKPWPDGYTVNAKSPYGYRRHPITGRKTFHHGVDVAGRFDVRAAGDGVVRHKAYSAKGGGHVVGIEHGSKLWTFYYHGRTATAFKVGDRIQAGDFIYESGTTGASTGNHLHFETRRSRRWGDTLDPMPLLQNGTPQVLLQVNGIPSAKSWSVWQDDLKANWGYTGRIDGVPGRMTYSAIQRYAGVPVNGVLGPQTRAAVQKKIGVKADGQWGRITWSEIQRRLNTGSM